MAENWSDEELAAAVSAYKDMAQKEANQKPYSKRQYYRDLATRFGRTEKSFEYRMQNISAVLHEQGLSWIPGLKPAGNVGANVKPRIEALLSNNVKKRPVAASNAAYKSKLPAMRQWLIEVAQSKGTVFYSEMMQVFDIDRFSLRHAMDYLGHQSDNLDEPIITALIISKGSGHCSVGFSKEFKVHDDAAERQRLYEYWTYNFPTHDKLNPPLTDLKARAIRFAIVASRPDQAAFRREVYEACGGRCVISGCAIDNVLDAAHRHGRDWRLGHNKATDGYLLRKDLHALYDKNLLIIGDDGIVTLAPEAQEHYKDFAEKKVT